MNRVDSAAASRAGGYVICTSGTPVVAMQREAVLGIHAEALAGLNALRRRGAEIGGLLIGRRTPEGVTIESHASVECEHRYGPSYVASETDCAKLEGAVSEDYSGLEPVGFYRSDTRTEFAPDSHDAELIDRLFPHRSALLLLVRPARGEGSQAVLYVRGDAGLEALTDPSPFPFSESANSSWPVARSSWQDPECPPAANAMSGFEQEPREQRDPIAPAPESPADMQLADGSPDDNLDVNHAGPEPAVRIAMAQVPPEDAEPPAREQQLPIWVWVLLVAGLAGIGAILGYLSVASPHSATVFVSAIR